MNVFFLTILFISFLNNVSSITTSKCIALKNRYLRIILLSDKKNIKIFKRYKNFYKICYNEASLNIIKVISNYNSLTEDEKTLFETILSLCY
jgi:hypothetical protein